MKIAFKRKRIFDLLDNKELAMFKMEMGDYKFMFEYDTEDELKAYLDTVMSKFKTINSLSAHDSVVNQSSCTFADLEISFIANCSRWTHSDT